MRTFMNIIPDRPVVLLKTSAALLAVVLLLGPPAASAAFRIGISSHLSTNPEKATPELMHHLELGTDLIRRDFYWHVFEPERGEFEFAEYDALVDTCLGTGCEPLGLLAYGNPWAFSRPWWCRPETDITFPPSDPTDFAGYVYEVVARYGGLINIWEVWNEENIAIRFWKDCLWPFSRPDPAAYGDLLSEAYLAAKTADPGAFVLLGGLSWHGVLPGDGALGFLGDLFRARPEIISSFDGVAFHPYDLPLTWNPPEHGTLIDPSLESKIRDLRARLDEAGAPGTPIWITEMGYPSYWPGGVSRTEQAEFLARSLLLSMAFGVEAYCWYTYSDGSNPNSQEGSFGLVTNTGEPKPAFDAFGTACLLFQGGGFTADLAGDLGLADLEFCFMYETAAGTPVIAAWNALPEGKRRWCRIPFEITGGRVRIRDFLNRRCVTADVHPAAGLKVPLTSSPVYVELLEQ